MNKETTCQDCAALPNPAYRTTAQVHVDATSKALMWVVWASGYGFGERKGCRFISCKKTDHCALKTS